MNTIVSNGTAVRTVVDQMVRWAIDLPDHLALLVGTVIVVLVTSFYACVWFSRRLGPLLVRLSIWVVGGWWVGVVDLVRRWLPPRGRHRIQVMDSSATTTSATAKNEGSGREYLRIRPTSAAYDPETLVTALRGLQSSPRRSGVSGRWRRRNQDVLEFLAVTRGPETGVEFYVGGTMSLDRLAAALPYRQCGFDIERVSTHPAHLLDPRTSNDVSYRHDDGHSDGSSVPLVSSPDSSTQPSIGTAPDGGTIETADGDPTVDTASDDGADAPETDPTDELLAHLHESDREPVVYRLDTRGRRCDDWMMRLPGLTDLCTPSGGGVSRGTTAGAHPLTPVIETLDAIEGPAVYQVTARSHRSWGTRADMREHRIRNRRDTAGQRIRAFVDSALDAFELDPPPDRDVRRHRGERHSTDSYDRSAEPTRVGRERLTELDAKDSNNSFIVNVRVAAVPTAEQSRHEVASAVRGLWADLEYLDGDYYHLAGPPSNRSERIVGLLRARGVRHRQRLRRLCRRELTTPTLGHTRFNKRKRWPDLVCTPDELAVWTAVPSTAALPDSVLADLPHRPAHTDPQAGLTPAIRDRYVGSDVPGVQLGYLLTDDGGPALEQPVKFPVDDQQHHAIELGASGTGKSTDVAARASQYPDATQGPVIILTGPGANVGRYTMRALAARKGLDWLDEHVHWFPVPTVVPGVAPLNLESVWARDDVDERWDAVTEIRDQLVGILRGLMGSEAYDEAQWSTRVINRCIEAAFDPVYWEDNAPTPPREGPDACRFAHVRTVLDRLGAAGQADGETPRPELSTDDDQTFQQVFEFSDPVFGNIMGGAYGRLDAISDDRRRRLLFASMEPEFAFADVLDSNDVYIFDLSALQDEPQQLMALTLVTLLNNALEAADSRGWLHDQPDDYLVNVVIDEAAFVAGSEYFTQLLAEGRNYRIGLDLATQYLEQFADEVGGGAMRNVVANTDTKLVGTHVPSDRLAEVLQPEALDVTEVRQLVRDLPEAHRVALLPRQEDAERPQLLTVHRGPLPAWHPDSDATPFDEASFADTLEAIRERTQDQYGVTDAVRQGVYEGWETLETEACDAARNVSVAAGDDRPLDAAMAEAIRAVQLREAVRDANGWVDAPAVDAELMACLETFDTDVSAIDIDPVDLPDVREASPLIEVDLDRETDTVVTRLSDDGAAAVKPTTGDVQSAGGDAHDALLTDAERMLTEHGFSVRLNEQDGRTQPDGTAVHPDHDVTFTIEAETTTPDRPAKVLRNLARAHHADQTPIFVVRPGDDATEWATRIENICLPPLRELADGTEQFYNCDEVVTFGGGATVQGGVTAVRPRTADSNRTVWQRADGDLVLSDGDTEFTRVPDVQSLSKDTVPAYYSYDRETDRYTVYTPGETQQYESSDAFDDDWMTIKRPFLPSVHLPTRDYDRDSYLVVILPEDGVPLLYQTGATYPLSECLEQGELWPPDDSTVPATDATMGSDGSDGGTVEEASDRDTDQSVAVEQDSDAVEVFAAIYVRESEAARTSEDELFQAYLAWLEAAEVEGTLDKGWFTRKLGNVVDFEVDRARNDGERGRSYDGIDLAPDGHSLHDS